MTAPSDAGFETLIYTDCTPGQGLQGSAGLQFQARSPGATREAMSLVQRNLLYEPPSAWMRDRRAVDEYPPSFAHIAETLYATASGVYLGREANGGREGNQLTHSIVTGDAGAYRQVRPAQLFGAPFWTAEPAPSTACATLSGDWEAGPFDAGAAQEFVRSTPDGFELLTSLLAALEQVTAPDGRRVLFIAEDPVEVLRWITVATLLMPQERAVRIGFKVFSTDPAYAAQPVVAVHPGWGSTTVRVDNAAGYIVVDLVRREWTPVPPSPDVARRVELFAAEDPYDVVDLVELAGGTTIADPMDALALGTAMVLPEPPLDQKTARIAVGWLRDTDADLLAAHRGALVDRLTSQVERWPQDVLTALDAVAARGQVPEDRVAPVRLALIEKELARATAYREVTAVRLPPLPAAAWRGEHRVDAERMVTDTLRTGLEPGAFDAVLRVAHRFGLTIVLEEIGQQVYEFVADWVKHPDRAYDPAGWPCGREIWNELLGNLDATAADYPDEIGDAWWRKLLAGHGNTGSVLGRAILGAAMVYGDDDQRLALVDRVVGAAARSERPADAVGYAATVLWRRRRPRLPELRRLCGLLSDGPVLDDRLFEHLRSGLDPDRASLKSPVIDLMRDLIERRLIKATPWERALVDDDVRLRRMCENIPVQPDPDVIAQYAKVIKGADRSLVGMWAQPLVAALLAVENPLLVPLLLDAVPHEVYQGFRESLLARLQPDRPSRHVVTAFVLTRKGKLVTERDAALLQDSVAHVLVTSSDRRLKPVLELAKRLGGTWARDLGEVREQAQEKAAQEKAKTGSRFRLWNRGEG
jgi:hypothetical protein